MKDNISQDLINNRKIIIEIRNTPNLKILDCKGSILEDLTEEKIFSVQNWATSDAGVKVSDHIIETEERQTIFFDIHRLSVMSSQITSIDKFFNDFKKIFDLYKKHTEKSEITRIGCRIIGTYNCKSKKISDIVKSYENAFPSSVFLDNFPVNDLKLTLKYNSGIYELGPVYKDDSFILKNFKFKDRINKEGFGIDTDNYILKNSASLKNISKIQDVLTASLAVEKALVDKLKDF